MDISGKLISEEEVKQSLASIFVDSIVLSTDFHIKVVSQNLLDALEFSAHELIGKSINYLTHQNTLHTKLQHSLQAGYFDGLLDRFHTKSNSPLACRISGFYLGMVSDLNGYIILKIQFLEQTGQSRGSLEMLSELDRFIYRTSHDLRGPLATVRGLINLLKLRKDNAEVDKLVALLDAHAEKLDDRLFRLFYLSGTHDLSGQAVGCLEFDRMRTSLEETCKAHSAGDVSLLISPCEGPRMWGINEFLADMVFNNLLLYFLGLPKASGCEIGVRFSVRDFSLEATFTAKGFVSSAKIRNAIRQPSFIYHDLLTHPLLVNYYAAQKVITQLRGEIAVLFSAETEQTIYTTIPLKRDRQLSLL